MKAEPTLSNSSVTAFSEFDNNPLFTLTVKQIEPIFKNWIYQVLQSVEPEKEVQPKYLTRVEACEKLHISLPTLTRYSKLGIITAKKVGNRILYIQTDIEKALSDIPTRKLRP